MVTLRQVARSYASTVRAIEREQKERRERLLDFTENNKNDKKLQMRKRQSDDMKNITIIRLNCKTRTLSK